MINIEIDGVKLQVMPGQMIIEAADLAGIPIPRFCYHKKLSVAANCRMCLVEVAKAPKALPACATPVSEGMVIHTCSDKAKDAQRAVMEFLLINHPLDCPVCDQGGECELQDVAMGYGSDVSKYTEAKRVVMDKDIGPLVATELTRCIHCTRCIRFGTEIAGMRELGATGRGEHMTIGTFVQKSVDSELSANIIDLCPVGALTSKPFRFKARSWEMEQHRSVAAHDCVGSNLFYHTWRSKVMRVVPAENNEVNEVWLSDRDRFACEGFYAEDRLLEPMVKLDGQWKTVSWAFAMKTVEDKIKSLINENAAGQLGALTNSNVTTEEAYLLQKLMRALGSNNVDHRLLFRDFSDEMQFGVYPNLGIALESIESQEAVCLIGSYAKKAQPLFAHRCRKLTLQGGKAFAINPMQHEWHFDIDEWVPSSSDLVLGLAQLAKALIQLKGEQSTESDAKSAELDALLKDVEPSDKAMQLAKELSKLTKVSLVMGDYVESHLDASSIRYLVSSIGAMLGATVGTLSSGANTAGLWFAGLVPHRLPGGKVAKDKGLNVLEQLSKLSALILMNVEPEADMDDAQLALKSLENKWVLSITPYVTDKMKAYSDVLLPMATINETAGSFINAEGRMQFFKGASKPLGEARPAWKILRVLGNFLNLEGFDYKSADAILSELKELADNKGLKASFSAPKTLNFQSDKLAKNRLIRITPSNIYGLDNVLRRAKPLQETNDAKMASWVHLHPELASGLGVKEGDKVSVSTLTSISPQQAKVVLPVKIDEKVPSHALVVYRGEHAFKLGRAYETLEIEKG